MAHSDKKVVSTAENTYILNMPNIIDAKKKYTRGGITFAGYNKPKMTPSHPTKKAAVLAKKGNTIKLIRFGDAGMKSNYSAKARKSYLARSGGIKNGKTKLGANKWARSFLWGKSSPKIVKTR